MRWVYWSYWTLYTALIVSSAIYTAFEVSFQVTEMFSVIGLLISSFVMYAALRGKRVHMFVYAMGLVGVATLLAQAHMFSTMSFVTPYFYALFLPAALFLLGRILGVFGEKT